ncbi:HEXXH motif domain-containing protein [Saccharothrix syringae]|nr:HEXXH motif domain-containing protein [Saccharothrix syringae]
MSSETTTAEPRTRAHLSDADFDLICAGPVDARVMGVLHRAQYGRRRLALRTLLEVARRTGAHDAELAWEVLAEAERRDPASVEDVLMAPAVGTWLARALRRGVARVGVLHAVAAAAAMRAGMAGRLVVPVSHDVVTVPTIGQYAAPGEAPTAELGFGGPGEPVRVDGVAVGLRPFRRHRSEAGGLVLDVTVDDVDPHRGFVEPASPDPLDPAEHGRWCDLLDEAWALLVERHTGYAVELSAGLTSLVPLPAGSGVVGASSASAFGAVALSAVGSAAEFAETLVHEIQHSKLNAVLDLVRLHDEDGAKCHYAPWRDDPRPLTGVLHGLYAFTGVVEFWQAQSPGSFAAALRARQLRLALAEVGTRRLTGEGRRFVAAVARRLAALEPDPAASPHAGVVDRITADHRAAWRVRHVRPHPADVAALADDWLAGRARSTRPRAEVVATGERVSTDRAALLRARALTPERFAATPRTGPDAAYARDDLVTAGAGYLDRLRADPEDGAAWVGLGLAGGAPALLDEPHVARAVHREVRRRGAPAPDPLPLARWLAG